MAELESDHATSGGPARLDSTRLDSLQGSCPESDAALDVAAAREELDLDVVERRAGRVRPLVDLDDDLGPAEGDVFEVADLARLGPEPVDALDDESVRDLRSSVAPLVASGRAWRRVS